MGNPHDGFILAAYGVAALVLAGLVAWIMLDGMRLRRSLAEMEARGISRRSAAGGGQEKAGP